MIQTIDPVELAIKRAISNIKIPKNTPIKASQTADQPIKIVMMPSTTEDQLLKFILGLIALVIIGGIIIIALKR